MSEQGNLKSIQSMMDGYNPYKQRLDETRQLVTKWEPTGLLEGIDEESKVLEWQLYWKTKLVS